MANALLPTSLPNLGYQSCSPEQIRCIQVKRREVSLIVHCYIYYMRDNDCHCGLNVEGRQRYLPVRSTIRHSAHEEWHRYAQPRPRFRSWNFPRYKVVEPRSHYMVSVVIISQHPSLRFSFILMYSANITKAKTTTI